MFPSSQFSHRNRSPDHNGDGAANEAHRLQSFLCLPYTQSAAKRLEEVNRDSGGTIPCPKNSVKNYMSSEQITQETAATTQTRKGKGFV
jgi:hypothetical protein